MVDKSSAVGFNGNLPLCSVLLPNCLNHPMVEFDITVEVPYLGFLLQILVDLRTSCIKMTPVRFRVKRKRLTSPSAIGWRGWLQYFSHKHALEHHTGRLGICSQAMFRQRHPYIHISYVRQSSEIRAAGAEAYVQR